ncbi:hypothetical protein REC12_10505 [Desulfosporosinus sp. PR]|uniref:hypothetical protein n=1 Tax=Candidatus Desulfosporosinus nitrosoreducens TaxID=3401928 RepID=UPI0027F458C6|nr:hypothetical protein [Desulfosporosinus sp. PR]MDQ7094020.1 hypothetical protein [Desulfosporosinus sp. PR]
MGNVIKFKAKLTRDKRVVDFLAELNYLRELFLQGEIENVIVIANGKGDKCCTSSGVSIDEAKAMCRDFIHNTKEYFD